MDYDDFRRGARDVRDQVDDAADDARGWMRRNRKAIKIVVGTVFAMAILLMLAQAFGG